MGLCVYTMYIQYVSAQKRFLREFSCAFDFMAYGFGLHWFARISMIRVQTYICAHVLEQI